MQKDILNKLRAVTKLLIASSALNFVMLGILGYWHFKERPPTPICGRKPEFSHQTLATHVTNSTYILSHEGLSFKELLPRLQDKTLGDNGYTHRDLTLGYLVTNHYFDISRALIGNSKPTQKRYLTYKTSLEQTRELIVYSGLNDTHYSAIESFALSEKWPFTSKGLFSKLLEVQNDSLKYAFFITPEFMTIEHLFKRASMPVSRNELLGFILEGTWEMLTNFTDKQRIGQNFSEIHRRNFLLKYIEKGSTQAAALFLKIDSVYAQNKLDDDHVIMILKLSKNRTVDAARFALATLASPRSDAVWKEASHRLYEFTGEVIPKEFSRNQVLSRFLPLAVQKREKPKPAPVTAPNPTPMKQIVKNELKKHHTPQIKSSKWKRAYTVMNGDSLWKISRMFKDDVNELKKQNSLTSDSLTPGTMIIVP